MKNAFQLDKDKVIIFIKRKGELLETVISVQDFIKVDDHEGYWYAWWSDKTKSFYVKRNLPKGKSGPVFLHRLIMDDPKGFHVDHIDHNTLNNTRSNLRILTHAQNQQNRKGARIESRSGIRGVGWHKQKNKWRARVTVNGREHHIGLFENIDDAEKAVKEARKKLTPFSVN
ncbi:HNH endonuclease [Fictibacillus sp. Mic-4]|uniref:HNH endonuclease n=1 Tax=Fictibacillus sp. Mic-4 TaxID=3132826 RepID=UPI003CE937BC